VFKGGGHGGGRGWWGSWSRADVMSTASEMESVKVVYICPRGKGMMEK